MSTCYVCKNNIPYNANYQEVTLCENCWDSNDCNLENEEVCKKKLDLVTRLLCTMCKEFEHEFDIDPKWDEISNWWEQHKTVLTN